MRLLGDCRNVLVGQALGVLFRFIQAETVHFPNYQGPVLRAGLPHLSDAELFANRSALFANGGEFRYAPL